MFLRLLCIVNDSAEYKDEDLSDAQMCLEHYTRRDVWSFRSENMNPKANGISVINTPGNTIKGTCLSATLNAMSMFQYERL